MAMGDETTMKLDLQNALEFAYRANINRYRRLMSTYLTSDEREFVERRLGEEEKALRQITGNTPLGNYPDAAE